ncbi:MAG: ABC transporter substrate-binding protein [Actinobacteria bacterium]|jgi:putative spermidine/putrescine transport system substrate-binding protein|nr:ABC transporter substrate-binding protein [Actinomycetota bacterium]NBU06108.1 ABC transporter substrate-binding protein [Acidimicrobiia bacterium]NDE20063.1 ABC transporter substrate-binding protein [Actinomycetota bacterium]NDF67973.1 ABC transporter substrate-binding protein [Actinomycetota bacterium]NDG10263.1 ABC transporter substrate-binding protein [Actinomycetota bacterium]
MTQHHITTSVKPRRNKWRALITLAVASSLVLAACGGDDEEAATEETVAEAVTEETSATAETCPSQEIVDAANAEGQVNLIALPDNWANYKGILESFRQKYPNIANPVANPDASSADELVAYETLKGQPTQPDAFDVSPAIAQETDTKGYWEPYKPCNWDEIPEVLKDPDGKWVAAYYGIMAIGTNTTVVENAPASFADLKKPEYKGLVSLNGDPREAGAAFAAVVAATLANGGSFDDIMPGIRYFADLKASGNLAGTDVTEASVIAGETPIWLDWTYNYPGLAPKLVENGITWAIRVPSDGVYGGYYAQGGLKDSPNPNAAKLWIEHIISDEGALGYLEGGAIPARFEALVAAGKVTEEAKKNLPAPELIAQIKFPTQDQIAKMKEALAANWGPMVADK